ncbi:MAG: proline racemase family protein [Longimicrobiales bacterium]
MQRWSRAAAAWTPPGGWRRLVTVDAHTAGEPLRVVVDGFPQPVGSDILARRRDAADRYDALRRALMWEPRGHADMYGCLVVPPVTSAADFGVLFTHNAGYSTMCGHGIVAVATVAVELGLVAAEGAEARVGIDTPAGFVAARVAVENGRPRAVTFRNVPAFVAERAVRVDVPDLGTVECDIAYGGAFYAVTSAEALGLDLTPRNVEALVRAGRAVKAALVARGQPVHPDPERPDLGFLYGVIFVGPPADPSHHSRNVCVFADGEVDRSPTGTGVSARLALHHARGEIATGDAMVVESILGTTFVGRVVGDADVHGVPAVLPEVTGSAHLTGRSEWWLDPADPLAEGFLLR